MGNYVSCTLSTPLIKSGKAARVILPGGEFRQYGELVNAAELMLECPNFFLTNSQSLHIGNRFSALSADEELDLGNVYIMFPMKRLNSVVTTADMAMLFMAEKSSAKRMSRGKVGVLPEIGNDNDQETSSIEVSKLNIEGIEELKYRSYVCRSRKPSLETIKEEPVCSRFMDQNQSVRVYIITLGVLAPYRGDSWARHWYEAIEPCVQNETCQKFTCMFRQTTMMPSTL